ncbi:probable G-protein coupled receptor No18 isoform X2 [Cherax quadricarinatus]|nr:probable G-protein coupled receptor No18 isoform X2 [Cherax quadricarinatus]
MVAVGVESVAAWAAGVAITLALAIVFLVSSILNTVFLIIFFRRPALRSISNRFIVSLTVCNLLASWLLLPLVVADTFLPVWESASFCRAMDAVAELVASASVFATLLIAVDRFCAITDPLHYHMLVTRHKSLSMIFLGWLLAALIAVAASLGDLSGRSWKVCGPAAMTTTTDDPWTYRSYFVVANMVVSFTVPMMLLVWIYIRIYHAAHKNSERTRRNSLCGITLDAVTAARGPSRTPSTRSTSSQIVTNLRHRISNASLFLHKEESRAAKISVVVIVLFFACWLPYYAAALLHTALLQVWVPGAAQSLVLLLALSNSAVSPYVYLYRSRRIQREVRRLLGLPLSTKTSGGSYRRRPHSGLQLQMIPPSPTIPDANFDSGMNPYVVIRRGQLAPHRSPLAAILTKLFRAKGFAWESWRDSFTSSTSSSTVTTSTSSASTSSGATTDASNTESESMLPRVALAKTES